MDHMRQLVSAVLIAGALSGLAAFGVQHVMVEPLILRAEAYEEAARRMQPGTVHEDHEWEPSDGFERTAYTGLSTVLMGVGYAALLLGAAWALDVRLDFRRGAALGVAAFACVSLAPALGLPPQPPGAAVGDLHARQLWWLGTVVATATGLWLLVGSRHTWLPRAVGIVIVLVPHLVGAPLASGAGVVPMPLVHRFALASVASSAVLWVLIGTIGGYCAERLSA